MRPSTHLKTNPELVGRIVELAPGHARTELLTTSDMVVDEQGLVHGGFIFGLADYAAMLAVNDPNVVLGAAETRFLKPVAVGQTVVAEATVQEEKGRKRIVSCTASREGVEVFTATFTAFVLDEHVLGAHS